MPTASTNYFPIFMKFSLKKIFLSLIPSNLFCDFLGCGNWVLASVSTSGRPSTTKNSAQRINWYSPVSLLFEILCVFCDETNIFQLIITLLLIIKFG